MKDKSVLFVDDEQSILNSLKRLLRKEPYRTLTALGGEAGLAVLREIPVQVIVTDQRMPGMTGTEFLTRAREVRPDSIRVILSGYAEAGAIVEAINTGEIYRFIEKPWNDHDLLSTIRQCLEHHDIKMENRRLNEQSRDQLAQLKILNTRLENHVRQRTQSLQLAQDVIDTLPAIVLGISHEGEVMIANTVARDRLQALQKLVPGTDMNEILPAEAATFIQAYLDRSADGDFTFTWDDLQLAARPSRLGGDDAPRGCVLLLEEVPA